MDKQSDLQAKFYRADELASRYTGDARAAEESGNLAKADRLWAKAQHWADRRQAIQDKLYSLGNARALG